VGKSSGIPSERPKDEASRDAVLGEAYQGARPVTVAWKGSERYEVLGSLGEGAMGCVYKAFDRHRNERVAVKTLRHLDGGALYRLKQEFRTLADVRHPNLVRLHELLSEQGDGVFFSMELVDGRDFVTYARQRSPRPDGAINKLPGSRAVFEKLRPALVQLVEGVAALHAAGRLHRDLKPSNVLVTSEGRVVVLDFGVATELRGSRDVAGDGDVVGTPTYMSPEQALGDRPDAASDWYSVGVMLYEAIVGDPPFVGSAMEIMSMKCRCDATPPSARVGSVPEDLDALCVELLAVDAEKRPTAVQILSRLRPALPAQSSSQQRVASPAFTDLIGRERHLAQLHEALVATQAGRAVSMRVSGTAGMGKSALVHHFLDEIETREDVVVLRGRTYERESVPYKVFDALIDALSRHLVEQEGRADAPTLPADIGALGEVFPVLRRVASIDSAPRAKVDDPRALRQHAFAALRELLGTLARSRTVVLFVDDVHWGDIDSAALLLELVRPPGEPSVLFLTTNRTEEAEESALLAELRALWPEDAEVREVEVGPLDPAEARSLARAWLPPGDGDADATADTIARESGGSPFLIGELARSNLMDTSLAQGPHNVLTLEHMVDDRIGRLPEEARRLLEVIAVGGRPLPLSIVGEAAEISGEAPHLLAVLEAHRFVRAGLRDGLELVETAHDRIRETLVDRIPAATLRRHHARLAQALEHTTEPSAEAIATHLLGAAERERAGLYAERAAEVAMSKLAFAQSERLLQLVLETLPADSPRAQPLRLRMAKASEWAGHAEKAARAYLVAAAHVSTGQRLELERAAGAQLIAAGLIDDGVAVFHRALTAHHIRLPESRLGFLWWTAAYRVLAGVLLVFVRGKREVSADHRVYLNTLQTMGRVLAVIDPISANYIKARYLCEALWSGSDYFVLRAAIFEAGSLTASGGRASRRERNLFKLARRLAEETGDKEGLGHLDLAGGVGEYLRGHWQSCVDRLQRAQARLAEVRAWQANASIYGVYALTYRGDLPEAKTRTKSLLADAQRRGDRYTVANLLASHPTAAWLASDDVVTARRQLKDSIAHWSQASFLVQHWQCMLWESETHLYVGDGERAWQRLARDEGRLADSSLFSVQLIRALTLFVRGRSAVASLRELDGPRRTERFRHARKAQRSLERERMPWIDVMAALLGAAIANASGNGARAQRELRRVIALAGRADMPLHGASARHRLGLLLEGEDGAAARKDAEKAMQARGVRVPVRYAQMLLPGEWQAAP
jgi:serine/threonine protein kinase